LQEVLTKDDFDEIKTKTEELSQSLQEVGTHLYQQQKQEEEKKSKEEKPDKDSKEKEEDKEEGKKEKDAKDADYEEK